MSGAQRRGAWTEATRRRSRGAARREGAAPGAQPREQKAGTASGVYRWRRLGVLLAAPLVLAAVPAAAGTAHALSPPARTSLVPSGGPRALARRYEHTGYVGVAQTGNALLRCAPGSTGGGHPCADVLAGTAPGTSGDFDTAWTDTDGDPATFDSASARLVVPPGAAVDFAGLYWGGDLGTPDGTGTPTCLGAPGGRAQPPPAPRRADTVRLRMAAGAYLTVPAGTLDEVAAAGGATVYQGFADITALLRQYALGGGPTAVDLGIADVQLAHGPGCAGGWSVVLAYSYPTGTDPAVSPSPDYAPAYRTVTVLDGLVDLGGGPASASVDGLSVPASGPAGAVAGTVGYGPATAVHVSVDQSGATRGGGGSAVAGSGYGATLAGTGSLDPADPASLGYDSAAAAVPDGVPAPGAAAVTLALSAGAGGSGGGSGGGGYAGVLVFAVRATPVAALDITLTRPDGTDAGGDDVAGGQQVTVAVTVRAVAGTPLDQAGLTLALPAGLTPVPQSAQLDGQSAGTVSGTTLSVPLGGLAPGGRHRASLAATVDPGAPAGQPLVSQARLDYTSAGTAGFVRGAPVVLVPNRIDLAVTAAVDPGTVWLDPTGTTAPATVTVALSNQAAAPASGVSVQVGLPDQLTVLGAAPDQGTFDQATGVWAVGAVPAGTALKLALRLAPGTPGGFTVRVEVAGADQPDVDSVPADGQAGEDDTAAVPLSVQPLSPSAAPDAGDHRLLPARALPLHGVVSILGALTGAVLLLLGAMVLVTTLRGRARAGR